MIFQFSRETRTWDLLADTGELLGTAKMVPGDCWVAQMTDVGGGLSVWATDLDLVRDWMTSQAEAAR